MEAVMMNQVMALVKEVRTIVVGSVDENGYPNAKQMFKMEHEGLKTFWFSTNTSSMRAGQFLNNPKASLYFAGQTSGLMLLGEMDVCLDDESRQKLWVEGAEKYYPLGVHDPDYCVFKFTASTGDFYFNLKKHMFEVDRVNDYAIL
jgi:pyridoxamine 5'-phosphate oxidase